VKRALAVLIAVDLLVGLLAVPACLFAVGALKLQVMSSFEEIRQCGFRRMVNTDSSDGER
jgi:hypothetical protein